jgi:hypothetical protein
MIKPLPEDVVHMQRKGKQDNAVQDCAQHNLQVQFALVFMYDPLKLVHLFLYRAFSSGEPLCVKQFQRDQSIRKA